MNVTLLSCTPDALNLLLRTKNTRLKNDDDPATWSEEKRAEHLAYMLDTIKSSYEFVDYVFEISGVTRAFTHQLVRSRQGSYAQESQRTVDVRDNVVLMPNFEEGSEQESWWQQAVLIVKDTYKRLVDGGVHPQDARGILPTNVTTSIIAKFNLRTLHDMAKVRLCTRTQGEYGNVFREMRKRVLEVHPWADPFIQVHCVSIGTCAFPRYGKKSCQFYDPRMDQDSLREETRLKFWSAADVKHAEPRASGGKSM